jgi:hypothetical protein
LAKKFDELDKTSTPEQIEDEALKNLGKKKARLNKRPVQTSKHQELAGCEF